MGKGIPHVLQLPFSTQPGSLLLPPHRTHADEKQHRIGRRTSPCERLPLSHTRGDGLRRARKQGGESLVLPTKPLRLTEVTCTGSRCHLVVGLGLELLPPKSQHSLYSASLYKLKLGSGWRMASAPRPRTGMTLKKSHDTRGARESAMSLGAGPSSAPKAAAAERGGCVQPTSGTHPASGGLSSSPARISDHAGDQRGVQLHLNSQKSCDHSYHHIRNDGALLEMGNCDLEVTDLNELPSSPPCLFPQATSGPVPS